MTAPSEKPIVRSTVMLTKTDIFAANILRAAVAGRIAMRGDCCSACYHRGVQMAVEDIQRTMEGSGETNPALVAIAMSKDVVQQNGASSYPLSFLYAAALDLIEAEVEAEYANEGAPSS